MRYEGDFEVDMFLEFQLDMHTRVTEIEFGSFSFLLFFFYLDFWVEPYTSTNYTQLYSELYTIIVQDVE